MPVGLYDQPVPGRTDIDPTKWVPHGLTRERKEELDHMSDKDYFNAVLSMTPEMRSALMVSERERIRTFSARWPIEDIIKGADIAKEGFFFTGNADRVECAFCRGVLRNWERGDSPRILHKDYFTYCNFAQGRATENIPASHTGLLTGLHCSNRKAGDLGLHTSLPHSVQFASENVRKKSFVNFPSHCPVSPADLAQAGFYYNGDADRVKCFFCSGILGCWTAGDQPWVEHAKWFPGCAFVVQQKGWPFVQKIRDSMTPDERKMSGEYTHNHMSASTLVAAENERKKSFVNFPSNCPVNPANLAQAGFYYTGDVDRVKCFFCGGILDSWTSGDHPWVRHVKCFPWCPFVVLQKGSNWEGMSRKRRYEDQSDPDHINGALRRTLAINHMFDESEQEQIGTSSTRGCMEDVKGVINVEEIRPSRGQDNSDPNEQRSFEAQEVATSLTVLVQSMNLRDIILNPNALSLEESSFLIEMSRCRTC